MTLKNGFCKCLLFVLSANGEGIVLLANRVVV